jgi:group II intron reverse transcriptase/maturase
MEYKALLRLEQLRKANAKPGWVNSDLYRLLYKPDLYIVAYEKIKSKPGNMTPGVDGDTLDGFSMDTIGNIIEDMRKERFNFSRARRVYIPKTNGGRRPLGIAPPKDKVVQEVIRMILEAIYDSPHGPTFLPCSHGFRPNRAPHTALKTIRTDWSGIVWIVEGDIKGCFDNIDHETLLAILRKRIHDERFLGLIRKALTAGYLEFQEPVDSIIGTPQGSIISPVLANIYMHEFDEFVMELTARYDVGTKKTRCPIYRSLEAKLAKIRKELAGSEGETRQTYIVRMQEIYNQQLTMPVYLTDRSFIRVKYLRYADDWVIGINGPRHLAEQIREEAKNFLLDILKLTLSVEKTHIRHAKSESSMFLGTDVRIGSENPKIAKVGHPLGFTYHRRVAGWTPIMKAPIPRIIKRLCERGFCDAKGFPRSVERWTILDDDQIVKQFNMVLLGYLGYYSFTDNFAELNRITYVLRYSAAKTLAHRHKTKISRIFRSYGRTLAVKVRGNDGKEIGTAFAAPKHHRRKPMDFRPGDSPLSPDGIIRTHLRLRTRSKLGKCCVICGETEDVEMHHVRHIRKLGDRITGFAKIMASLNRKQIPVCARHHGAIHRGELDSMQLTDLADLALAKA